MNPIFLFETPIYGLPKNQIDFNNSFCAQAAQAFTFYKRVFIWVFVIT